MGTSSPPAGRSDVFLTHRRMSAQKRPTFSCFCLWELHLHHRSRPSRTNCPPSGIRSRDSARHLLFPRESSKQLRPSRLLAAVFPSELLTSCLSDGVYQPGAAFSGEGTPQVEHQHKGSVCHGPSPWRRRQPR